MSKRLICLLLAFICAAGAHSLAEGNEAARSQYVMDIALDTQADRISETVTVTLTNNSDDVWESVWFHDYVPVVQEHANPGAYASIVLSVTDAQRGEPLSFENDRETGLITVTPPKPVEPGETLSVAFVYEADIPNASNERFQVSAFQKSDGVTYKLCQFFPMLCVWRDGEWVHHPYEFNGEAFYSECADFSATLRLPKEYVVVASGGEKHIANEDDRAVWRITAQNMRDFVIMASTEFSEPYTGTAAGHVTVNSYYATSEQSRQAQLSLQAAINSVELFEEKFGPYPYDELDVCITRMMEFAAGIEYPGLVEIWQLQDVTRSHVRTIVSHEVAHQWFYGVVGNDQYDEAFLDEAFAFFSQVVYMRYIDGKSKSEIADTVRVRVDSLPVDLSLDEYKEIAGDDYLDSYTVAVYRSGRAFLWEIQQVMGDEAFFEMVRQWYADQSFKTPTIDQFLEHLYAYAGRSQEITALVAKYMRRGQSAAN